MAHSRIAHCTQDAVKPRAWPRNLQGGALSRTKIELQHGASLAFCMQNTLGYGDRIRKDQAPLFASDKPVSGFRLDIYPYSGFRMFVG
jgi:hypothetical protein